MSQPHPAASDRPTAALHGWLAEGGARFKSVETRLVPGMGRGLVATSARAAGDELLFVPRTLWLTRKTEHTRYGPLLDRLDGESVFPHRMTALALLVALERSEPASFFATYLGALGEPTVPTAPKEHERLELQGLPRADWIDEQAAATAAEWEDVTSRLTSAGSPPFGGRLPTLPEWRWAAEHVLQRSFSVGVDGEEVWVLVPGMDLCNHADEPNACYFAEEDGWCLEASRPIAAGEQVAIRYGRTKTSSNLLLEYGFVTPDNPHDRLRLELELADDDPDRAAKLVALDVLGLSAEATVGADGALPTAFLHAAVLWGLDSDTFRADQPDVTAPERAVAALTRIAAAIEDALAGSPTSLASDLDRLVAAPAEGWTRAFVQYRVNAKRVHRDAARALRRRAVEITDRGWRRDEVVEEHAAATTVGSVSVRIFG